MKRLLFVLLLVCAVFAQDTIPELTGCENRGAYYLCDQAPDMETASVNLVTPLTCGYIGEAEEGCYATAYLTDSITYKACKVYVPNPVDYARIERDYQCSTKTVAAGTEVNLLTTSQWATDCKVTQDEIWFRYEECAMEGKVYDVQGTIMEDSGDHYLLAITMAEKEGYIDPIYLLAVGVAATAGVFFLTRKKKK